MSRISCCSSVKRKPALQFLSSFPHFARDLGFRYGTVQGYPRIAVLLLPGATRRQPCCRRSWWHAAGEWIRRPASAWALKTIEPAGGFGRPPVRSGVCLQEGHDDGGQKQRHDVAHSAKAYAVGSHAGAFLDQGDGLVGPGYDRLS